MYKLVRFEHRFGKYEQTQTHIHNEPYYICKAVKNKLEAIKWPPKTFFKIERNESN